MKISALAKTATLALAVVLAGESPCLAESRPSAPASPETSPNGVTSATARLRQSAAELKEALREYRASLERLLALHEQAVTKVEERRKTSRELYERGAISRRDLEQSDTDVATAQARVDEDRRAIAAADQAQAEAAAMEAVAALPVPRPGEHQQTAALSRYQGQAVWSLASITSKLQQMFFARFGRALPISALGQTAMHDRMGFDHRNALDVAVHPDSPEGQALLDYLRTEGVPFIAYRGAVPGAASGAHVHVGLPSPRITVVTHSEPRRP
jgi:hypothetical protein